ncbi:MAG: N-acetylmuramoyl-L-alanine amidase [Sphaerospermopsis sp. SIO1G1]|nr:N-acetylmuramoyl-L-alanine amidase [Sphaerospermopsis sp. SIO1G1]
MKKIAALVLFNCLFTSSVALAETSLLVVFPPRNYQTSTEKIFFIGTAPPGGKVFINDQPVKRSEAGHFSPSLPLKLGKNVFKIRYQNQEREIQVTRLSTQLELPKTLGFVKDSLTPNADMARLPGELICFSAIAPPRAIVSVKLANQTIPLSLQPLQANLPGNSSVLTGLNQPTASSPNKYQGCTTVANAANLGQPQFSLKLRGKTVTQSSNGSIKILAPTKLQVVEVTSDSGVARTGPSTTYSRLTPLPRGTRATVTGRDGDWLRLDYGGWINSRETRIIPNSVPPKTVIRSIGYRRLAGETEIRFPLQTPVPVTVEQGDRTFSLTLHNTTAQTDTIRLDDDPLISRLDWQQATPDQIKYTFNLKNHQQWGYKLRYDRTTLVLTLRHPPNINNRKSLPLSGIKILLDPGHGGKEKGAIGPTGYPEKDVNLIVSKLLRDELVKKGATVVMTREDDRDVSLVERQQMISREEPAIAISIHYNALPGDGDAENTRGFGTFWYHPQAHNLAIFLQNYVVEKLRKPYYGVFWNNLALTRPSAAPAVLLELGFMINPQEFEEIVDPQEQRKMARTLADGVTEWFRVVR